MEPVAALYLDYFGKPLCAWLLFGVLVTVLLAFDLGVRVSKGTSLVRAGRAKVRRYGTYGPKTRVNRRPTEASAMITEEVEIPQALHLAPFVR